MIHVVFGAEGARVEAPVERRSEARPDVARELDPSDPLQSLYSRAEVARLFDLSVGRLRYWARTDFLQPSARRGTRAYYTFQDLIGIRAAKGLLDRGLALQEVRRSVDAIRAALPRVVRPLAELRVVAEGRALLVHDEGAAFEPTTGQLVLDFRVDSIRDEVVRVLRPAQHESAEAYARYLEGCRLDEDEATFDDAEAAYRDALRLDPSLTNALTNLGNLRFRRGDEEGAVAYYEKALAIDPSQPEALYNLGFVAQEHGDDEGAVALFEGALASDPSFADAHFNLALALTSLGRDAGAHWRSYLALEPEGEWAEIARRHLRR
ncbi:MAG: tetratricopeptide repeat protein [Myxococcota bacterium]